MSASEEMDPYEWETDSDPDDDPGLVHLISRIAKKEVDPACLPLPDFKRVCRRLEYHEHPTEYAVLGTKRLRRIHDREQGRLHAYSLEDLKSARAVVDPVIAHYAAQTWHAQDPEFRPSSPRFVFDEDKDDEDEPCAASTPSTPATSAEDGPQWRVSGNCNTFALYTYTTREDVGAMLTLMKPCLGDFNLSVVVAGPGTPFVSCISKRRYGDRHVDFASSRLVGRPAWALLDDVVGFEVFGNVNGYGRSIGGACSAQDVLRHLATAEDGPNISVQRCYGNPEVPPGPTQDLDDAARALVAVLTKYGSLQEAIAPGCASPVAKVLAVYMPDGNNRNVEVVTVDGTHLGVYFSTS